MLNLNRPDSGINSFDLKEPLLSQFVWSEPSSSEDSSLLEMTTGMDGDRSSGSRVVGSLLSGCPGLDLAELPRFGLWELFAFTRMLARAIVEKSNVGLPGRSR